ncbi:hypothetical protein A6C57_00075 [Fibrella sp. ES10-3-2-2]|nr:hypothetical protein A6C57_00075 [Fibrella sp. ES10-3-2-2]
MTNEKTPDQTIQGDNYGQWLPDVEFNKTVFVMNEVIQERKRQHAKFGQRDIDPVLYATILNEEVGEVNRDVCEYAFNTGTERTAARVRMRAELIQVAAVALAMVTCMDRNPVN